MKLSIWQWIGAVLLVVGLVWYAYDAFASKNPPAASPGQPAATSPAMVPALPATTHPS